MGMMRSGNFASRPARPVKKVAAVVWAFAALVCIGVVWLLFQTNILWTQSAQLQTHKARLIEETDALAVLAVDAPTAQELSQAAQQTARFNAMTGPRATPLSSVLYYLETNLPQDVRVSQLVYDAETGALTVGLQALTEADLPPALRTLEEAEMLKNVILERQLRVQQGAQTLVQYDIRAVAL